MPGTVPSTPSLPPAPRITRLTNCRVVRGDALVWDDLWISAATGRIVDSQAAFFDDHALPDTTVDLGGRIVAPGLIDCQLNGAFGFNFSTLFPDGAEAPEGTTADGLAPGGTHEEQYAAHLHALNRRLVQTGVTSYAPTVTSQTSALYRRVLPLLAAPGHRQAAEAGAESLGAHVEGPFLSPTKNGVHNPEVFQAASSLADVEAMYGPENLVERTGADGRPQPPRVRIITAAPEIGRMADVVFPALRARGIVCAIGHSEATYEQAARALAHGATMITHLFNAMRPLHHRNPGIFGVLGEPPAGAATHPKPFFGVIADGIHLHPTTVRIAYNAHPEGFVLVTDAMHMVGLPDGPYAWTNGARSMRLVKTGKVLLLEGSSTIAGSTITLIECVENFLNWSGVSLPRALQTVTATPAAALGLHGVKGTLDAGADADLVVLSTTEEEETETTHVDGDADVDAPPPTPTLASSPKMRTRLHIDEVWKFGVRVHKRV